MECEDYLTSIEEYFDGELDAQAAARVRAHTESCAGCASYYEELKAEQAAYAHYRRDVDVTPAMWAAVEARIERENTPAPRVDLSERVSPFARLREWLVAAFGAPRLSPAFAAALVVAAVGITVAVMVYTKERAPDERPQLARGADDAKPTASSTPSVPKQAPGADSTVEEAAAPSPEQELKQKRREPAPPARGARDSSTVKVAKEQTPEQLVREAEQKYLAAIAMVERDVKRRRENLDPALLVRLDNALASIDLTIEETRKVVRQHPGDPVALQYLLAAYSKKIDALREMARE
ncbi:MAG TPA: zf-HC2 domain-containing protein [Blastocatellia bacterium]|nr:zf-HC2 domain-containing protein [Blastocatellia bacterium]